MKFVYLLNFISTLCICINSQRTFLDSPKNIRLLQEFRHLTLKFFVSNNTRNYLSDKIESLFSIEKTGEKEKLRRVARQRYIVQDPVPARVPFPCNVKGGRSTEVPTSIHKLKPGDIDIVAALGDSITAGFGALATNFVHLLVEYRSVSFIGGGEGSWRQYLTIPNILKEFNPKLIGYSKSDSFAFQDSAQLNLGTTGAMSSDLPFMAETLVQRMRNDSRVDVQKHWKFISIMMGANDFCSDMCYLSNPSLIINNHKSDLTTTLRIIRDNLPRTFVSLTPPPHIKDLYGITGKPPYCDIILDVLCPCIFGTRWNQQRTEFFEIMTKFQLVEEEIANSPEFQRKDFAVVVQPFTVNLTFPSRKDGKFDPSFLAPDCFHVTQKVFARAANAIWNTLFEPVGQKTTGWMEPFKKFNCPTSKRPFLATLQNSKENGD